MTDPITIWTYDWVPNGPRGFVRDMRLRWALEEAGLPYRIATVPITDRGPEHLARQPFAQVPFIDDGGVCLFESGACLLHIAEKTDSLMPPGAQDRADVLQWLFAALNSVELVTVPWWFIGLSKPETNPLADWMGKRLDHLEAAMAGREWVAAGRFTIADIALADVLRVKAIREALDTRSALRAYVDRACDRLAFRKALDDQMAHFAKADADRDAG